MVLLGRVVDVTDVGPPAAGDRCDVVPGAAAALVPGAVVGAGVVGAGVEDCGVVIDVGVGADVVAPPVPPTTSLFLAGRMSGLTGGTPGAVTSIDAGGGVWNRLRE